MPDDSTLDPTTHTNTLLPVVCSMLDGFGYNYLEVDETTVQIAIGNQHGIYQFYFTATDETDLVRVIGYYGSRVPVDRRPAVMEALTRINWRLSVGGFEMNLADGGIRFRIGMDVENGLLSEKMADNMLGLSLFLMEQYHEALMRVAFGDADPEVAVVDVP